MEGVGVGCVGRLGLMCGPCRVYESLLSGVGTAARCSVADLEGWHMGVGGGLKEKGCMCT